MFLRKTASVSLGLLALLAVGMARAAPPDQRQDHYQGPPGQSSHSGQPSSQGKPHQQGGGQPSGDSHGALAQSRSHGQPPQDFNAVYQAFHERREQIGRGPAVPSSVHLVRGQPLPAGYGKRLDSHALQGLPYYQGHEWRRVGSDVVLVTVATGIVYTILSGVLN